MTATIIVLTIGITAIAIMANKTVKEIQRYNELKAKMDAEEARRAEARERIKKIRMMENNA